jgi:mono/diheme cytochrome c family protein
LNRIAPGRPGPARQFRPAAAAAALAAAVVLAANDPTFASTPALGGADGADDGNGAEIYRHLCQGCHMAEGQGAVGAGRYPKLARNPALVSSQYVALIVLGGRNGMPAFGLSAAKTRELRGVSLSDADIAAVVNYVRTHFGNAYADSLSAEEVTALPHPPEAEP